MVPDFRTISRYILLAVTGRTNQLGIRKHQRRGQGLEFHELRDRWEREHELDEVVDESDIAEVVAQWTGIPVSQMMETESEKLLHMEQKAFH